MTSSEGKSRKWQHKRLETFIWNNPMQKGRISLLMLSTKGFNLLGVIVLHALCWSLFVCCESSRLAYTVYLTRFFQYTDALSCFSYVLHPLRLFAIEASDILRSWLFHIILSWGRKWYHYRIWKPKIFCWLPCTADEAFLQRSLSFSATNKKVNNSLSARHWWRKSWFVCIGFWWCTPLKNDGWNTTSLLGFGNFSVSMLHLRRVVWCSSYTPGVNLQPEMKFSRSTKWLKTIWEMGWKSSPLQKLPLEIIKLFQGSVRPHQGTRGIIHSDSVFFLIII